MNSKSERSGETAFDVAVIGAGVIGCAVARRFTLEGARVVVLEKAADVLDGASKANSAILHTGFDAPENSLELACVRDGHAEYRQIREALNLPLDECGALVLAWTDEQEAALEGLIAQARHNGIDDVQRLASDRVRALEPQLAEQVRGGFRVPGESLIDPWSAPHAYLLQALLNGAELQLRCELQAALFDGYSWTLQTTRGELRADTVINCAGLYGDRVEALLLGRTSFAVKPRKGQFVVYDKSAAGLLNHILLPVPTAITKGIVVCRTVYGNVLVGPTAEEQGMRDEAHLEHERLQQLRERGEAILPALAHHPVTALYAGLRPATEQKDYHVAAHPLHRYIAVGGIRSTGLSSALGTARYVHALYEGEFGVRHQAILVPIVPRMPNLSEGAPRGWEQPGNGGIVCHCERVTRAEIEAALGGPLAAQTLAGLKRRTRITMGRCQGYYCAAELAALTQGRLAVPLAEPVGGKGHA